MTTEKPLAGRRALVTGGAGGIGEACAAALAASGAHVTVADVNAQGCQSVADRIGGTAWPVDLLDDAGLADLRLDMDILVNNAGIQHVAPIQEFPPAMFRRIQRLMVETPFLLVRAVLPHMYQQKFGRVINISSVHGLRASAYKSAYVAAKHGIEGLSKVIALEGAEHGVTSNCISPGYVRTALVQRQIDDQARVHGVSADKVVTGIMLAEMPIKRLVEPEEIGALAVWLAGPSASMVTGSSYTVDGGWSAG